MAFPLEIPIWGDNLGYHLVMWVIYADMDGSVHGSCIFLCSVFVQKLGSVQSSGLYVGFLENVVGLPPILEVECKFQGMFVKVSEAATDFF